VAHGVDAKSRVEHGEDTTDAGEQKAAQPADPAVVEKPCHKGEPEAGENDHPIVAMLPHDDGILA